MILQEMTTADGFEYAGHCLFLFFAKREGQDGPTVETATSVREAKAIIKEKAKDGFRLCWKSFGPMFLPSSLLMFNHRSNVA